MLFLLACATKSVVLGSFDVELSDKGSDLTLSRQGEVLAVMAPPAMGVDTAEIQFQSGSYQFSASSPDWTEGARFKVRTQTDLLLALLVEDADHDPIATMDIESAGADQLAIRIQSVRAGDNRLRLRLAAQDEPMLGTGGHAFDVDHRGEAYPLWVAEPGVGKSDSDSLPDDWFLTGTRHASSYPQPFLLLPDRPLGLRMGTDARIELDLGASNPEQLDAVIWAPAVQLRLMTGEDPLAIVQKNALLSGTPMLPPDWTFAAWVDAIRGAERVQTVADELRAAKACVGAIWTEDWKGGEDFSYGYHLSSEWDLDEELYPDASTMAANLEAQGYKWLAYFSPFIAQDSKAGTEAADLVIKTEEGEPYWFPGVTFAPTSVLDLTLPAAQDWAASKLQAALDIGFDGWMTDFGEWLPTDAVLYGADALNDHNAYPSWWQEVNATVIAGTDATYFSRSGWDSTPQSSPITWAGDQRTDFSVDDGFATVIPMGLGLSIGGLPIYTHDIGGYQSLTNEPSTKELWFRWCELGAFTPIMRTHHGAFDTDNWQFDTDAETLAHFARYTREHARLFPYLRALAKQSQQAGTPMILHPALLFPSVPWQSLDVWMLGPSLYVAPVLTEGASTRRVDLPAERQWYDWWTGAKTQSGEVQALLENIPVFVPEGSLIPTLTEAPDTFLDSEQAEIVTLSDADLDRTIKVFGAGGSFVEADGTRYSSTGQPTEAATSSGTFASGSLSAGGLTVNISGETERLYRLEVYP